VAGTVRRCPRWMGEAGFEWLWRLACEPRKLWRRDFLDGPRFLKAAAGELFTETLRKRSAVIKGGPGGCRDN